MGNNQVTRSPGRQQTRGRLAAAAAMGALAVVMLCPATATASQVDNEGEVTVDVWFDCGIACGNYFKGLAPGGSASRPNKAGRVAACTHSPPKVKEVPVGDETRVSVGAHGEVGVNVKRGAEPQWSTFTWSSKGGNSWTGSVTHDGAEKLEDTEACWRGTP